MSSPTILTDSHHTEVTHVATFRTCSMLFTKNTSTLSTLKYVLKTHEPFRNCFADIFRHYDIVDVSPLRREKSAVQTEGSEAD